MKIEGGIGKLQQVFEAGVFECLGRWWRGVLRKLKSVATYRYLHFDFQDLRIKYQFIDY